MHRRWLPRFPVGRRYLLSSALLLALCMLAPTARPSQLPAVPEYGLPDLPINQPVFSLFAARGELVELRIPGRNQRGIRLTREGHPFGKPKRDGWRFRAPPEPGVYTLRLESPGGAERSRISLFVGYPVEHIEDGRLNGYLIGQTPPSHKKYPSLYRAPEVYYEVTPDNIDTRLSPHFTLRQFLCKQASDFPKYVVLRESLLLLLEGLVQAVREAGFPVQTLGVISGYRTPWYNQSIGNVSNSRHVYGDAFDFFVDVDGDGRMDDLNGNGRHDRGDVDLLADLVDRFMRRPQNAALLGGLGRYYKTSRHGGFVHVDTRGFAARW
jgi:hypothetical protein